MREQLHRLGEYFQVLSNGVRLQIIERLMGDRLAVVDLAGELDRPPSTVSRHLRILREKDLVQGESVGQKRYYFIKRPELLQRSLELESLLRRKIDE